MMPQKKQKANLFSTGVLASAATGIIGDPQREDQVSTGESVQTQPQSGAGEEDDPLFGNAKRILTIAQKATSVTDVGAYPKVATEKLLNNPYQPRRRMNTKRLEDLAREIKTYGFKGVLLARMHPEDGQNYQLVYGHRRRDASKLAGLSELPVMVDNTISDDEMKFLAINENVLRDDLTPLDEAYAYTAMLEEMSQDAVAARLGVSRGYIRNRVDILKAPEDVQDMVEEKPDTMKAVVYLKDVQEDDIRKTVIRALLQEELTINQIKAFIENLRKAQAATGAASAPASQEQNETTQHPLPSPGEREETDGAETVPQIREKKQPEQTQATMIQYSKKQTEAVTDTTKIETFTKYLQKYDQRLDSRALTADEEVALDTLVSVVRGILERRQ